MKEIKSVGVIGAGTMGAALAQKFIMQGFSVVLMDMSLQSLEKGILGIHKSLEEAVSRNLISNDKKDVMLNMLSDTDKLSELEGCDLVVEAIFENESAKKSLFQALGPVLGPDAIVATNTSSFSVTDLADSYLYPGNFIGLHYFYHAAKNRLVEIIPGEKTTGKAIRAAELFSFQSGKDPIMCRDSNGFVVNRFFVPWLNESARLLEEGIGTMEEIDFVCRETFGIGMGPFVLMNATGVPVAYHSQVTLENFGNFYTPSEKLKEQALSGNEWPFDFECELNLSDEQFNAIRDRMLGTIFFVCCQMLDEAVCEPGDMDRGARIGLKWRKGPVSLMKQYGEEEVKRMIGVAIGRFGEKMPLHIVNTHTRTDFIHYEKNAGTALLHINRPEDLNALNEDLVKELDEKFSDANSDREINDIVITGSGKAFVAGADVRFFVKNIRANSIDRIVSFTKYGQEVFRKIDHSTKNVVVILNGMTFGGGLELALCADLILSLPSSIMAFPETGIGIYPGLGGTHRSKAKVGKGIAKYLISTGAILNAKEAVKIGLVDKIISAGEMYALMYGENHLNVIVSEKNLDERWKTMESLFGQHSIEEILEHKFQEGGLSEEEYEKLCKKLRQKAPVALKISEELIEGSKGDEGELEMLGTIFRTNDALLGLSSIGKAVEFKGN